MANAICPKCGADLPEGTLSCEVCGANLNNEYELCPDCKSVVKKGALFCSECGAKVNDSPTPVGDFSFIEAAKQQVEAPAVPPAAPAAEAAPTAAPAVETAPAAPVEKPAVFAEAVASAPAAPVAEPVPYTAPDVPRRRTPPPPQPQATFPQGTFARNTQPPKGSRYAPVSSWGFVGIQLLFSIPVIGWIFCLVWACGACTKVNKRNYARSCILLLVLSILIWAVIGALLYFFAGDWLEYLLYRYVF